MMAITTDLPRVLIVDDEPKELEKRVAAIAAAPGGGSIRVDPWRPDGAIDLETALEARGLPRPDLVVTDKNLSHSAASMSGTTVVDWCQEHAIPVGFYSRRYMGVDMSKDLFRFHLSGAYDACAVEVIDLANGFHELSRMIRNQPDLLAHKGWATMLAHVLGRPEMAGPFSLYSVRTGVGSELISRLSDKIGDAETLLVLAVYEIGHLLRNGIIRYPGPIANLRALCSYLAVSDLEGSDVARVFAEARYQGPFSSSEPCFWHDLVEELVDRLGMDVGHEDGVSDDRRRRMLVARLLAREPRPHTCERCEGLNGGYRCPYTDRTVCERDDCSVPTSSWVPSGAYLTRVERDYFDTWGPLISS